MANLNSPSDFFGWEGQSQQGTPTDQMGAATTALFPWEVSQPQASQSNEFVKGLQFGWKQTEALGHAAHRRHRAPEGHADDDQVAT